MNEKTKVTGMRLSPKALAQVKKRQERERMTPGRVYEELLDFVDRIDTFMECYGVGIFDGVSELVYETDPNDDQWIGIYEGETAEEGLVRFVRELQKPFYEAFRPKTEE